MNIEGRPSYIMQHNIGNYGIVYLNYAGADTVFILGYQMVDAFGNTMCNTIWQHNFFQDSTEKYYTTNIMDLDISDWDISNVTDISEMCKKHNLYLYLDGARLGSALVAETNDLSLPDICELTDIFYIGGTKVGALCGEAIVFTKNNMPKYFLTHCVVTKLLEC